MKPNFYRTPAAPGYLGRYQFRAVTVGLLCLGLACMAATQFIAKSFDYQQALGHPVYRSKTFALYRPYEWMVWGFRYCTERDDRIATPVKQGCVIAFLGSFLSAIVFAVLANRRPRKLSQGSEDLHGSARWATPDDVKNTGLVAADHGVYVGGWESGNRLNYLRHNGPEHVLAFAPTRSGKGVGLVIPTLLAWEESAVMYDIKGENWAKTAGFRRSQGHLCFKFSPVESTSSRFNPLAEIRLYTQRDVSDAQNIANMIVRTGEDSASERYWQDSAASIVAGMVLHVCYTSAKDGRTACLADLANLFTTPGKSFRETLEEDVINFGHDPDFKHGWRMPDGERTATHPVVKQKSQEMLNKEDKDFSGVLSTVVTALTLFADPLVSQNTSASDFSIDDLVNHEKPVSLYLVVPPSDKIRLRPLIRLIFTMVVNRLTEKMDFQGAAQKKNRHRLLFLIDEFPSLKRMDIFADALSYMAGYGLKAYLITQDIRQIREAYGEHESIVSNCHVRVAYAPNQQDTCELLSKMTGVQTVPRASYSFSGSRYAPAQSHLSGTVEYVERPLMTPDEVSRLKPPTKQGEGDGERITAPGQMLIFVSGRYPILGTQMLYFLDPVLSKRSDIAAPTEFVAISGGEVKSQKRPHLTENRISRPETASRGVGDTFIEQLSLKLE
jgi:type IV secretion system protein VirD4